MIYSAVLSSSFLILLISQFSLTSANCVQEQPLCLTVNLTTLLNVCRSFFRVPCPQTCGVCASENFKQRFLNSIDPNSDQRIGIDEAHSFLKNLNISLEDALVTEIRELLLDSKAVVTDLYELFDTDDNGIVTLTEFIKGYLSIFESFGVKIKPEFKESISNIAEIIKVSNMDDIFLPKLSELIQAVAQHLNAFPHGLMTLSRLQNMTNGYFNLERLVTTQQLGYSVNTKLLTSSLLARFDRDSDGFVSQSDFIYSLLNSIRCLNISLSAKVEENLKTYFDIYHSSVQSLLNKYGLSDSGLLEGKILPEFENKPFINLGIIIQDSIQTVKKYSSNDVMRYIRTSTNSVPQRKLTPISIIESTFGVADRNKDGQIDIPEFVYFSVSSLPKEIGLSDMNESLKVMKLHDENNDDKLSSREFKELLKPEAKAQETYLLSIPNPLPMSFFIN